MKKYKVYAGMSGGFNDVSYRGTFEVRTEEEAYEIAYECAVEQFESFCGMRGVMDYAECLEECNGNEEDAWTRYEEEIESWVDYYIEEVK